MNLRWSLQLRLTLLYAGLFLLAGAMLLAITYLLVANSRFMGSPPQPTLPQLSIPGGGGFAPPGPDIGADLGDRLAAQRARDLQRLLGAGGVALAVMTVLSGGLGWIVARRALRPLRTMAGTARTISERNLHERLAITGTQDEVKELADTFDGLLTRLEGAFEAQRRFVANASHELRTPLTVQRSLIEVALADDGATTGDLRHTCERVLVNNQHQERLIEALLTLARSQRGLDRRLPVDLDQVAAALVGDLDAPGAPRIETDLAAAPTEGDRPLVERLATNLIENAVRHNTPGGWLRVRTGMHQGRPSLWVSNSGPRIRPDQIGTLFQPFQRLGTSRTTTDGRDGLGIGLSIVDAIATAHGATIEARPLPEGGLDVLVQFQPVPGGPATRHHPTVRRAGRRAGRTPEQRTAG
jgi:signal transduction histidine kinase